MTILQSLDRYYDRLPNVAPLGWAPVKFGWCIVLDQDGGVVDVEDLRDLSGKKPKLRDYLVPRSDAVAKRTSGIVSSLFWDKTAYVLGRTAGEGKRTAQEHSAFLALHRDKLAGVEDEGLVALRRFVEAWLPERLEELPRYLPEMLDANIMFRMEGENRFVHERPAARALVEARAASDAEHDAFCLVTGEQGPVVRLHPTIKGVEGAQSSGAALVSFNLDAFASLGKEQGENAPTSEAAAFRYGTALNQLLTRDGPNRLRRPIGDATVVFWADASDAQMGEALDQVFAAIFDSDVPDEQETRKAHDILEHIVKGRPADDLQKMLGVSFIPGTRFNVLGLSPNAARLSVRFWLSDSFEHFAEALSHHWYDMRIDPLPRDWGPAPSVRRLLANSTAMQRDMKNVPPGLAGEVMRAVLTDGLYPQSLLSAALMRLRAGEPKTKDGRPGSIGWHAAALRGVLFRKQRRKRHQSEIPEKGETPMALDREHRNIGYVLGRLFAVYELAQMAALGRGVKATMRDKYFASASSAPASVFPLVIAHGQNHLSKARKTPSTAGWAYLIERELNVIMDVIEPALPHSLPRSLRLEDQAEFAIGYYHQRSTKLKSEKGDEISLANEDENAIEEEDGDHE
jgi:CRISPR-associated protein Csd1